MRPVLDELARNTDAALRMNVIGYTDSTGSDAVNRPLSLDRAESVRDYLVGRGIAASRIVVDGREASDPVASNDSESGRANEPPRRGLSLRTRPGRRLIAPRCIVFRLLLPAGPPRAGLPSFAVVRHSLFL